MVWALFLAGLFLRVWVACARTDQVWPDEHFQTLEQAGRIVFGHGIVTWEWREGFRSWIPPLLYVPVLFVARLFGVTGGLGLTRAARVATAFVSAWVALRLDTLMRRELGLRPWARYAAVAAYALVPSLVLWGPATLSDTLALAAFWGALPGVLARWREPRGSRFWGGALAGLGLLVRVQMSVGAAAQWAVVFARALLRGRYRPALLAAAGIAACVAIYGSVDWVSWGMPFQSIWLQATAGLERSKFYGTAPWYSYLLWLPQNLGWLWTALGVWGLGVAAVSGRWTVRLAEVFVPCAALLVFYSLMAHKELRFVLPLYPAFFVGLALGLDAALERLPRLEAALYRAIERPGAALVGWLMLLLLSSASLQSAMTKPLYLSSVDVGALEDAIYHDGGLPADGSGCLLLINHNWSWTKGELLLGAPVRLVDEKLEKISGLDFEACLYAILPTAREEDFERRVAALHWRRLQASRNGYVLYRNDGVLR